MGIDAKNKLLQKGKKLHQPGIEPGVGRWQRPMLPLHHWCGNRAGRKWLLTSFVPTCYKLVKKFSIYTNDVKFIYLNFGLTYTQHCGFYKYKNQGEHMMHKQPSQKKKKWDDEKKVEAYVPFCFFLLSVQNIYLV